MEKGRCPSNEKNYYVYLKFDLDFIPRYVGKGKGRRAWYHEYLGENHGNYHMRKLVVEAASLGRELPTVFLVEGVSELDSLDLEVFWIKAIGRGSQGPLYNYTDGGEGCSGMKHSQITKDAQSARLTGVPHSPEHNQNISRGLSGKSRPPEVVDMLRNRKISEESNEKNRQAHLGRSHTKESRQKMREDRTGKKLSAESIQKRTATRARNRALNIEEQGFWWKHTEESKAKIGDGQRGIPKTEEHKKNISIGKSQIEKK